MGGTIVNIAFLILATLCGHLVYVFCTNKTLVKIKNKPLRVRLTTFYVALCWCCLLWAIGYPEGILIEAPPGGWTFYGCITIIPLAIAQLWMHYYLASKHGRERFKEIDEQRARDFGVIKDRRETDEADILYFKLKKKKDI